MKRIFMIMILLTVGILISGCSVQSSKAAMQIGPAALTEQEHQIIKLIQGKNNAVFDYTIGSDVKSISVACYKLDENGKWITYNGEGRCPVNKNLGRMAISFENLSDGLRFAIQEGDDITAYEYESPEKVDTNGMGNATSYASTVSIEFEKEIPLAIQVFTSKNGFPASGVEYFYHPEEYLKRGYDDVYVVAVKFSKNGME